MNLGPFIQPYNAFAQSNTTTDPTNNSTTTTPDTNNSTNSNAQSPTNTNSPTAPTSNSGSESGLVKCGVSRDCTICDIFILVRDIFVFALQLLAALAVLSMVVGGVYILVSAGNSSMYGQGVDIITNAVIGLLLVMASFLLFSFLLVGLGFQSQNFSQVLTFQSGRLFEIKCDNASSFNNSGAGGGGIATGGGGSGNVGSLNVACLDNTGISDELSAVMRAISFYEGAEDKSGYYRLVGGKSYPTTQNTHPGVEDSNLFRTTGLNSDAYGRFQMLSTTWNAWASQAGVPLAKTGTNSKGESFYNIEPRYQDAAVAKFLQGKGLTDCAKLVASANARDASGACQWASIAGCSQENDKTRAYPLAATCEKMLADEKTGACRQ
jgi:muramidase (phage lysozyme)